MALRVIWILKQPRDNEECQILLKRRFPTVEQRAKTRNGENYVQIPSDDSFKENLLIALRIKETNEFVDWRDNIDRKVQQPTIDIKTDDGMLWPVIVVDRGDLLLCTLPLVDKFGSDGQRPTLFDLPSVTIAFSVLEGIANLIGSPGASMLEEVAVFISLCLPFGTPYDTDPFSSLNLLAQIDNDPTILGKRKSTIQSTITPKGKSNISVGIRETVRCIQWHQSQSSQNVLDVYGSIFIKADLENQPTDVTVTLSHYLGGDKLLLEDILYHPCVHNTNWVNTENVSSCSRKKIKFTPPPHRITLCHYMSPIKDPPIYGQYEMKGQDEIQIELQLSLHKEIVNRFNFCEARFPFANRGNVRHVDCKPTWGHVHVTDDKQMIVWNIGQKFPKSLQVKLSAKVKFSDTSKDEKSLPISNSAYVQLHFLIQDFTMSGCAFDNKTIQFSPACKVKMQTERELRSAEYKIWNHIGEIPYCLFEKPATIDS